MPITFRRAPTVEARDLVTSTQLVALSNAFNDRIRSGVGDATFRIFFLLLSIFRQVRNSDGKYSFPPLAEFFEVYQQLGADSELVWPTANAGEAEGANVVSMMPGFVFGADIPQASFIKSEYDRLTNDSDCTAITPIAAGVSIRDKWNAAKAQRGGFAEKNGQTYYGSPAWHVASLHYDLELRRSRYSPHGLAYGGFLPYSPDGAVGCDLYKSRDVLDRVLNYYIKDFKEFDFEKFFGSQYLLSPVPGSLDPSNYLCQPPANEATKEDTYHVNTASSYPVFQWAGASFNSGALATFDLNSSIDSYTFHPKCVLGAVFVEVSYTNWESDALEEFSIEVMEGTAVLKTIKVTPAKSAQVVTFANAIRPKKLQFKLVLPPATTPSLSIAGKQPALTLGTNGFIKIEFLEQLEGKPKLPDAYILLRLAGGVNGLGGKTISDGYFDSGGCIVGNGMDDLDENSVSTVNTNHLFDAARRMTESVRVVTRGQLTGYSLDEEGRSVLYFKRIKHVLDADIDVFKGIAPSDDTVDSGSIKANVRYIVASATNTYLHTGTGTVTYNDIVYHAGDLFTGTVSGATPSSTAHTVVEDYTTSSGATVAVYQYDGILPNAPSEGWSNEWLMNTQLKVYKSDPDSIFWDQAYSDYFPLSNRCIFLDRNISPLDPGTADLAYHFSYGQAPNLVPEAPSGYNYLGYIRGGSVIGDNRNSTVSNYYKSCQVYQPDPEILSIVRHTTDGELAVTFKTRLHHCDSAPSVIGPDHGAWDRDALASEPYRTTENAIRQYLTSPGQVCGVKLGDNSFAKQSGYDTSHWGACYPHFIFTKLIPKPYVDANDTQDCNDTPISVELMTQMELYLRAMCEGYVAGESFALGEDAEHTPYCTGGTYDYTFRILCEKAFGGDWGLSFLPGYGPDPDHPENWGTTDPAKLVPIRPDKPKGGGVLPNTCLYGGVFNQYSQCLNLLTTARLEIPLPFVSRTLTYQDVYNIDVGRFPNDASDIGPFPVASDMCTGRTTRTAMVTTGGFAGNIPGGLDATTDITGYACGGGNWQPGLNIGTTIAVEFNNIAIGGGSLVEKANTIKVTKTKSEARVDSTAFALDAIPPALRENVLGSINVYGTAHYTRSQFDPAVYTVIQDPGTGNPCVDNLLGPLGGMSGNNAFYWNENVAGGGNPYICAADAPASSEGFYSCVNVGTAGQAASMEPLPTLPSFMWFASSTSPSSPTWSSSIQSSVAFIIKSCTTGLSVSFELVGIPAPPAKTYII